MKPRGFTVVDLVIALAVLGIVLTAVYSVFGFQQKTVRAASEGREVVGQAVVILDRISRDLSMAWLPQDKTDTHFQFVFEGRPDGFDLLTGSALSPDQLTGREIVEAGVRIRDGEKEDKGNLLLRRQDDTLDDDPEKGGTEIVLSRRVADFELTYYDQKGLGQSNWSAALAGNLPARVRILLVLLDAEGAERPYETVAAPALALPLITGVAMPAGLDLSF